MKQGLIEKDAAFLTRKEELAKGSTVLPQIAAVFARCQQLKHSLKSFLLSHNSWPENFFLKKQLSWLGLFEVPLTTWVTFALQKCRYVFISTSTLTPGPGNPLCLSRSDHPYEPSKTPGIYGSYLFEWWASSSHIKENKLSYSELKGRFAIKFDR